MRYLLDVKDRAGLLKRLMRLLAGNAKISFEGDLSQCRFSQDLPRSEIETVALKRNTIWPKQEFVILPLEQATVEPITAAVIPSGGIAHRIRHVQIEKDGELQFGAYDNFHPECTVVSDNVPLTALQELLEIGVLRTFTPFEGLDGGTNPPLQA